MSTDSAETGDLDGKTAHVYLDFVYPPAITGYVRLLMMVGLARCRWQADRIPFQVNDAGALNPVLQKNAPLASLLDDIQRAGLRYFWDSAHPVSGWAYDRRVIGRQPAGDLVSIGGTGFSALAIIVGVARGWISRAKAAERLLLMVRHLEGVPRFHGAFPHFVHGASGQAIAFSRFDDGGDLVETALLLQGLLCARTFFDGRSAVETELRERITGLYDAVEWDWYAGERGDALYWHWSQRYGWRMDLRIRGWNEGLIAYVLAAGSTTHPIPANLFETGWCGKGSMVNGHSYYGHVLPLGEPYGGPLFLSHYSFCTLDPRPLRDRYASYWEQVLAHARINHAHCLENPNGYAGYSTDCWGLTASHGPRRYLASSPLNDHGIIAPTAALSSFPYLPEEAEAALRHFLSFQDGRLCGPYGLVDAFAADGHWIARTNLAVNQGPIVAMIENHRSGLLWDLVRGVPEISCGLDRLGLMAAS